MHTAALPESNIVVWTDISDDQIRKLEELNDSESINNFFIKIFQFEPNTKRTTILCDLFYYALNFARTNKFNQEQISAFLSILKRVHDICVRTPFSNMEETYQYFKVLMLKHSLSRPPHYLRIFTPDVTKKVTDYIANTYFRHFKMYKYIFTSTIDFNLNFTYEGMTQQISETEEEVAKTTETEDVHTVKDRTEKKQQEEHQDTPQLADIRKLIHSYVKEEIRKIQSTTEEQEAPRTPQLEKHRSTKSGSTKTSKSQPPK